MPPGLAPVLVEVRALAERGVESVGAAERAAWLSGLREVVDPTAHWLPTSSSSTDGACP